MSPPRPPYSLSSLVREHIDRWHSHGNPDAASVVAEHPELAGAKSLVMDLALAEYSLRTAAGDAIEPRTYCERFPAYRESLVRLLEVQEYLDRCPQFAAADFPADWPIPGDTFLGFEIIEPLGRGGLARVFLARQAELGNRYVVIKVSPGVGDEADTLGKLSHESIVPIHSVHHDDAAEWTAICMPLLGVATGIDLLDAVFARGKERTAALIARVARETRPLEPVPIPPQQDVASSASHRTYDEGVSRLALELAEALEQAHQAGILHRDIKPSNILLAWSGRAMLLDFNLSTRGELAAERIGGTLAYMAPEIIASLLTDKGQAARRFDPRCDVYSLGVVLLELLTGRLPLVPPGDERLAPDAYQPWLECKRSILTRPIGSGSGCAMDARLFAIASKCLAFDPARRYESAAALAADLRTYLAGPARVRRFARRRRRELILGGLALALSGAGLAAIVAARPTQVESFYQQGLSQYEAGKFAEAVQSFTRCLELQPGWARALFGRGQALRQVGKWQEARTDYTALKEIHPGWAFAFAGYCNMRLNDNKAALFDFDLSQQAGLRNTAVLMNHALANRHRNRYAEAVALYTQVLEIDPRHKAALCERALTLRAMTVNVRGSLPPQQAFDDAMNYRRLEESFDGPYVAALIYADAAAIDATFEDQAIRLLTESIEKGLPQPRLAQLPLKLKRLLPNLDARLVFAAHESKSEPAIDRASVTEPPDTASWDSFQRRFAPQPDLVARRQ